MEKKSVIIKLWKNVYHWEIFSRRERLAAVAAMKASQGDSRSNNFDLLSKSNYMKD